MTKYREEKAAGIEGNTRDALQRYVGKTITPKRKAEYDRILAGLFYVHAAWFVPATKPEARS